MTRMQSKPGIPAHHRWLCVAWVLLYVAWVEISPALLDLQGERELAGYVTLWFIPTVAVGGPIGVITCFWPKWYTTGLFGICSLVHGVVGLGFFPK